MDFEFDPAKSAANLEKHGIDFIGAQELWSDADRFEIPARSLDEPRARVIERIGDVVWSAFITTRTQNHRRVCVQDAAEACAVRVGVGRPGGAISGQLLTSLSRCRTTYRAQGGDVGSGRHG